jgi:uncharacterized protein YwgA
MFDTTIRHGVITELAKRTQERGMNLGKTALQKHVYFLQSIHDVDVGYDFRLHTYGPFSQQILSDLDALEFIDGVDITYDSSVNGYRIKAGPNADSVVSEAEDFLEEASDSIDVVLEDFGQLNAKELELRATIVFAERDFQSRTGAPKHDELASKVSSIKPHFSLDNINAAIQELAGKGYIKLKK